MNKLKIKKTPRVCVQWGPLVLVEWVHITRAPPEQERRQVDLRMWRRQLNVNHRLRGDLGLRKRKGYVYRDQINNINCKTIQQQKQVIKE
jgi:hypothetical protein